MTSAKEFYVRVNGSMLHKYIGKQVHLTGKGLQTGNMSLKMAASDDYLVEVRMPQQPIGPMACLLEVVGTVTSAKSINAKDIILHPEWTDLLDLETYNSALETIHSDKDCQEYVLGL